MPLTANEIWRDFNTDGVPASGAHKPIKADIRAWGTQFESLGGFNAPGADTSAALFSAGVGVPTVFRKIVGFDLPNPSTTTPGAVFAKPGAPGQILSGLGGDGEFDLASTTGTGSVVFSDSPSFNGTVKFGTLNFAEASGGNIIIYGPDNRLAFQASTSTNFYKADNHSFYNSGGSDLFASLNAFTLALEPAALTGAAVTPAFKITQTWNTTGLVFGFDYQIINTASNPISKAIRIRSGPTGTQEVFSITPDPGFAALSLGGHTVFQAPAGNANFIYAANNIGISYLNTAGGAFLTAISNTGVWSFFGTTSGSHTLTAQAAASGASTFPNTTGTLINTGGKANYVLAASGVAISNTGNTAETTMVTIPVPANELGPNGGLRVTMIVGATGSAGARQWKIKFGGTTIRDTGAGGATIVGGRLTVELFNRGVANSQIASGDQGNWNISTVPPIITAIDTTTAQNITITGQLGNAADAMRVESYVVEILKP